MRTPRLRVPAVLGGAALAAVLAVPATSQATVPTGVSTASWNLRHSWVDYLVNPFLSLGQGRVTPTGATAADKPVADPAGGAAAGPPSTPYGYVWKVGGDVTTGGTRTVTLRGGLDFDQPLHGIDISLRNLRVVPSGSTETLVVDGSYKTTAGNTVTLTGTTFGTVSATGGVTLSAAGAAIFNGGSNGSYAAGDAFGTVAYGS
ncbi:HtaA domain-containing protein [Patulibacter sp. SYSU D01012]|uniref:HtaA domain-containing protein n=1 Tax=Patulibacter sp. SYSU D01012 TaxID=2817381 RepID=UPI001B307FA0|nr:HtaA domain-containing protein [Patulibacter sp. SYSU D01012]